MTRSVFAAGYQADYFKLSESLFKMSIDNSTLSIVVYPNPSLLLNHQHADHLATFVNNAYYERNKDRLSGDRVRDKDDLVSQLGATSLVVLISAPRDPPYEEPLFYALGSARPYQEPHEFSVMVPQNIPRDEVGEFERWELKVICTNPQVTRQGLGALLMDMLELAIKRRVRAKQLQSSETPRRPQIVLSAVREITGEFYKRQGFETCHEVRVGKGEWRGRLADQPNPDEFHMISMTKTL